MPCCLSCIQRGSHRPPAAPASDGSSSRPAGSPLLPSSRQPPTPAPAAPPCDVSGHQTTPRPSLLLLPLILCHVFIKRPHFMFACLSLPSQVDVLPSIARTERTARRDWPVTVLCRSEWIQWAGVCSACSDLTPAGGRACPSGGSTWPAFPATGHLPPPPRRRGHLGVARSRETSRKGARN